MEGENNLDRSFSLSYSPKQDHKWNLGQIKDGLLEENRLRGLAAQTPIENSSQSYWSSQTSPKEEFHFLE